MISAPLAERMRPKTLDEYIGQEHILATDASLRRAIDSGMIPSMILWGPPGVGKTTLAHLIAKHLERPFHTLSAISSGVKDVREIISNIEKGGLFQAKGTILFIDEIHRFSKSQQDSLLGAVEKGVITLIGATTENPSFEVISALLSRCQVYKLEDHTKSDLLKILEKSIKNDPAFASKNINLLETNALLSISSGDARKLLNVFEIIIGTFQDQVDIEITDELVMKNAQQSLARYDKDGEQHYDIISALIKSIRGSDPNAAIYWLARMIEGGEDPKFIARRLVILASEDIGLADPQALTMAVSAMQAAQLVGWPEARIILAQATTYLALAPKSNSVYNAINEAIEDVRKGNAGAVPIHLRDGSLPASRETGAGKVYKYAHDFEEGVASQQYLPDNLKNKTYYKPGSRGAEQRFADLWERIRQVLRSTK